MGRLGLLLHGINDEATQRAFRRLEDQLATAAANIVTLQDDVTDITTGIGSVNSVTAGSSMMTAAPTVGHVVVDVVPANFSGIPQAGVTNLVTDLATITTNIAALDLELDGVITGVTAGTNLSGGGSSGDVTLNVVDSPSFAGTLTLPLMTPGSVLFAGAGGLVSQDNANLFWDDTNNRLGIGTASPSVPLHVAGDVIHGVIKGANTTAAATAIAALEVHSGRSSAGSALAARPDAAFQWAGAGGGYRHFISTWHTSNLNNSGNRLRFHLNNSATSAGSSAPGTGNTLLLDLMGDGLVHVPGSLQIDGAATLGNATTDQHVMSGKLRSNATAGTNGQILQINSSALPVWAAPSSASIPTGTGTANTLVKWTGASTQGNSTWTDNGTLSATTGSVDVTGYVATDTLFSHTGGLTPLTIGAGGGCVVDFGLTVAGNCTLGDTNTADVHSVNGRLNINGAPGGFAIYASVGQIYGAETLWIDGAAQFNANTTIGNATTDAHALNGTLNANATAGTNGQVLGIVAGLPQWSTPSALSLVDGSGTLNFIPKWTPDGNSLGNSRITDNGAIISLPGETQLVGTQCISHINYGGSANEDTYLRAGKNAGAVIIGDNNTGGIVLGNASSGTYVAGNLAVTGATTLGDTTADVTNIAAPTTASYALNVGGIISTSVAAGVQAGVYIRQNTFAGWNLYNPASNSELRISNESFGDVAAFGYGTGSASFHGNVTLGSTFGNAHTFYGTCKVITGTASGVSDYGVANFESAGATYVSLKANTTAGEMGVLFNNEIGIADGGIVYSAGRVLQLRAGGNVTKVQIDAGDTVVKNNFSTEQNTNLGNAASDVLAIRGSTTAWYIPVATTTATNIAFQGSAKGSYDTTAGGINAFGVYGEANGSRSAGANSLTNIAGFFDAINGQNNYALYTSSGNNAFNVVGGSSAFFGDVTIGNADTDSHVVNGALTVNAGSNGIILDAGSIALNIGSTTIVDITSGATSINNNATLGLSSFDYHTANGSFDCKDVLLANYMVASDTLGGITIETPGGINGFLHLDSDKTYIGDNPSGTFQDGDLFVSGAFHSVREFVAPQITANQNNYNPTQASPSVAWDASHSSILYVNSDAARDVTGLTYGTGWSGRHVWMYNTGAFNITLKHQSASSTATKRFHGINNADVVLQPKQGCHLYLSAHLNDWIILA